MTTSKRTPEEIAEELRERIKRGDGPVTELILAALREAADAARQEEREALRAWAVKHKKTDPRELGIYDRLIAFVDSRSRGEEPRS